MTKPVSDLPAGERLAFLARAAEILSSSLEYETTLERVAQLAVPALADWCSIELLEESGELRNVAVAHSDPQKVVWARALRQRFPIDPTSPTGTPNVVRTGVPELYAEVPDKLLVEAARSPAHLQLLRDIGVASAIVVPLAARERTLGALTLFTAESGRRYSEEDVDFAVDLARRAAVAIENARLYSDAQHSAREAEDARALLDAIVEHSPIGKAFRRLERSNPHTFLDAGSCTRLSCTRSGCSCSFCCSLTASPCLAPRSSAQIRPFRTT